MPTYWDGFLNEVPKRILESKGLNYILELFWHFCNKKEEYKEMLKKED